MGLVIIVVLFIFVGLIYIMFAGKEDTRLSDTREGPGTVARAFFLPARVAPFCRVLYRIE